MNPAKAAAALNTASLALAELAEALIEQPEVGYEGRGNASPVSQGTAAPPPPPADASPFEESYTVMPVPVGPASQVAAALSRCPYHDVPWSVRPAGVSKAGKPYGAFYTCAGQEPDGSFCPRKPVKAWVDAHPIA